MFLVDDDRTPDERRERIPGPGPLRNPGWLASTFFAGVLWTNQVLLNIVIPLWLVEETDAPRVLLAFLFGTNTVMCIFLPMVTSRGVEDVHTALRAIRISSVLFVVSCLITLATHDTLGWVTIALVWLGHVTVTGAELYVSAASWSFEAELMDPRADKENDPREQLPSVLIRLMRDIGIPNGIGGVGYTEADVPDLVPGTMKQQRLLATCPKTPTEDDIADILTKSVENW